MELTPICNFEDVIIKKLNRITKAFNETLQFDTGLHNIISVEFDTSKLTEDEKSLLSIWKKNILCKQWPIVDDNRCYTHVLKNQDNLLPLKIVNKDNQ